MEHLTLKICFVTFTLLQCVTGWSYLTSRLVEVPEPTAVDLRLLVEQDIDYTYTDNQKLVTAVKSRKLGACFVVDLDPLWNPSDDDLKELMQDEVPRSFSAGGQYNELVQLAGEVVAHMCAKVPVYWFSMLGSLPPPPPRFPPANTGNQPARQPIPLTRPGPPELVPKQNPYKNIEQPVKPQNAKDSLPNPTDGPPPVQHRLASPVQSPVDNQDKGAVNGPPPLGSLDRGDLIEPPVLNPRTGELLEPPVLNTGGDGLIEPPVLNPGTEELLEPPVLNQGAGDLLEPPVLNGANPGNLLEPPVLFPGNLGKDDSTDDGDKEPFPTPPSLAELLGLRGDSDKPGPQFPGSVRSLSARDGVVAPPMIGSDRLGPETSDTLAPPKPDFKTPKPPLFLK